MHKTITAIKSSTFLCNRQFCIATMNEDFLGVINDDPVTAIQHSEVIHQVTQ